MPVGPARGDVHEASRFRGLELRRKFWAEDTDLGASVWMTFRTTRVCVEFEEERFSNGALGSGEG